VTSRNSTELAVSSCHTPTHHYHDRRVADLETVYDSANACSTTCLRPQPPLLHEGRLAVASRPEASLRNSFVVKDIFTDFKRHDLGTNFYERNWDGTVRTQFLTRPLWGAAPLSYGHDGRSITLHDVILRHGGEAQASRNAIWRFL